MDINCFNYEKCLMKLEKERLLVIAPHADDEIGCCGLINKVKQNGGQVFIQVLTLGGFNKIGFKKIKKEVWKKEFLTVTRFLNIDGYDIAFYDDKVILRLDTIPKTDLINIIESESKVSISKIKPTMVAIPTTFSYHQDHIVAYKVTIAALRVRPQNHYFVPNFVISYESPEYSFWSPYSEFRTFSPNLYLKLSKKEIDKKIQALNIYKSQLRKDHRDENSLLKLSRFRGAEIGVEYAEAFHTHRMYI